MSQRRTPKKIESQTVEYQSTNGTATGNLEDLPPPETGSRRVKKKKKERRRKRILLFFFFPREN
jgi:hypothetical protein